jgi:membrane-associated protease RseP (regulator of RpoE activity)
MSLEPGQGSPAAATVKRAASTSPSNDEATRRVVWNAVLFAATLLTTTWAGALHRGINLVQEPDRWPVGLPYAAALLVILGIHEMGHYLMARRRGVQVSLPYFIPVPSYLGTFGAFIRMRGHVRDRAAYFDVAIAGPLAGLVAAVIALFIGLPDSGAGTAHSVAPSSSLLLAGIYRLVSGAAPTGPVQLGAVAFAGWLGLIVTALNLIPVGQLDGGHIAYALLGPRGAAAVGKVIVALLVLGGLLYSQHLLMWALIVWFVAGVRHPPAQDEATPLGPARKGLAYVTLVLLLAIVLPWTG